MQKDGRLVEVLRITEAKLGPNIQLAPGHRAAVPINP
jgi:hypothetical protein